MGGEFTTKLDDILGRLRAAGWKEREAIKEELLAFALAVDPARRPTLLDQLEMARRDLPLELKWEIDEVVETLLPPPTPAPEPEKPEDAVEDPNKPLTASDLTVVYDDPRGLILYKSKKGGERWFAQQVDPRTNQPAMFELQAQEVTAVKAQLAGSPYWVLGAGEVAAR